MYIIYTYARTDLYTHVRVRLTVCTSDYCVLTCIYAAASLSLSWFYEYSVYVFCCTPPDHMRWLFHVANDPLRRSVSTRDDFVNHETVEPRSIPCRWLYFTKYEFTHSQFRMIGDWRPRRNTTRFHPWPQRVSVCIKLACPTSF